ncbi:MAG: hypothetical protein IM574_09770 [Cytophagales bacterium]|jgi:hypothetical protein|nr:hypothetical protein [Cytophagales bacterium]MCA6387847.1 hypothetical protein [Cytophagales bacterium]MCA6391423.1 hypothetical protein [Cytophagales bacterium]MCA6394400.1 hypothetical protein [Cytophagales bacterium]MCA6398408.1 hypothetical protein [Cytophagales bacterium]
MAKNSNIVHQYFRKEENGTKIIVRVNPIHWTGAELTITDAGAEMREVELDSEVIDDLKIYGFKEVNAIEFNLYLAGLL